MAISAWAGEGAATSPAPFEIFREDFEGAGAPNRWKGPSTPDLAGGLSSHGTVFRLTRAQPDSATFVHPLPGSLAGHLVRFRASTRGIDLSAGGAVVALHARGPGGTSWGCPLALPGGSWEWQSAAGTLQLPAECGEIRLVIGLKQAQGTLLVDDLVVEVLDAAGPRISGDLVAEVRTDLRTVVEPVNRRVLGIVLFWPPMSDALREAVRPILRDGSAKIFLNPPGGKAELDDYLDGALGLAKSCGVRDLIAIRTHNLSEIAFYDSEEANNVPAPATPRKVAEMIGYANARGKGLPITGFEAWNEPEYPEAGRWSPEAFSRLCLDMATRIHQTAPRCSVGASLREDATWNREFLQRMAAADPAAIDFLVRHPYDFNWMHAEPVIGPYYARAGGQELNAASLAGDLALAQTIGHGRWRLVLTEWGTHPPLPTPALTHQSTDLAAALSLAAGIQMFWDLGVDSAQFFLLAGRMTDGRVPHFALVGVKEDGSLVLNPTYHALRMYGEAATGMRLATTCRGPTYAYPAKGRAPVEVPLVRTCGIFDDKAGELRLIAINRHDSEPVQLRARLDGFEPGAASATAEVLTGEDGQAQQAVLKRLAAIPLEGGDGHRLAYALEPHSLTVITIKGAPALTESEKIARQLHFIADWRTCGVFEVAAAAGDDHGLGARLPCDGDGARPDVVYDGYSGIRSAWADLRASRSGFVDLLAPYRVGGLDRRLKENLQAVAVSHIQSPDDREVSLSFSADYWGRVLVNGARAVDLTTHAGVPAADCVRAKVRLRKGWNEVLVRVASGSGGCGFWLALEDGGGLTYALKPQP